MTQKYNQTAYNVLLCLDFILKTPEFQVEELCDYIENKTEMFLDNKTIVKYIRTLKSFGFKFKRKNLYTYILEDIPFSLNLDTAIFRTLVNISSLLDRYYVYLHKYNRTLFQNKITLLLNSELKTKIQNYFSEQEYNIKNNQIGKKLYRYCLDGQRLELTTKEELQTEKILIEPLDIIILRGNSYLKGFNLNSKSNVLINLNTISKVVQTPLKNKFMYKQEFAVLHFTSKLAQTYTLKAEDEIISQSENNLTVRTAYRDKELFFGEILKYWQYCEIVSPEFLRIDFKNFVDKIFKNYT